MSHLRTASSRRRGLHASTISSSRLRMDTHGGPRGNSRGRSPRHKEIDRVMKKARSESGPQSSYWTKKLLEVEEKDPNRWRHSGFKELYRSELGGSNGDSRSRSRSRSRNRSSKRGASRPSPLLSPPPRSRSPRDRSRSIRGGRAGRDRSRSPRADRRSPPPPRGRSPRDRSPRPRDRRDASRSRVRPASPRPAARHPRSPPPPASSSRRSGGGGGRRGRSSSSKARPPSPSSSSSTASSVESCSNESCSVCSPRRGSAPPARHRHSPAPRRSRSRSFSVPRSARSPPRPPEPAPPKQRKKAAPSGRRAPAAAAHQAPVGKARIKGENKRAARPARPPPAPDSNGALHHHGEEGGGEQQGGGAVVVEGKRRRRSPSGRRGAVSVSSESESESESASSEEEEDTPPRLTLSERFGRMAQWSVDRREFDSVRMRITRDSHSSGKKVVIEDGASLSPPPSSAEGAYARGAPYNSNSGDAYGGARGGFGATGALHRSPVEAYGASYRRGDESPNGGAVGAVAGGVPEGSIGDWDDVHVRYRYYRDRGYFWDMGLDEYAKWEEWWAKYQEWLEMERYYEQVAQHREWAAAAAAAAAAASGRPRGGGYGRRNRARSHEGEAGGEGGRRGKAWTGEAGGGRKRRR
ncbi:serine/arginine repetitive matrix protein 1-like [Ischnura elegans]|uniref:serine/arginine repetitive matrix protein 1-like n=1 Tax=Ischnura elegans TaxID=197161 RepID=UPI001ED8BE88|nr:serine/arginine repetitive matrix protein 1-like [Ischnura elegans]